MAPKDAKVCGRCGVTTVGGMTDDGDSFGEARIKVPEGETQVAPPQILLGQAKGLDEVATGSSYGQ